MINQTNSPYLGISASWQDNISEDLEPGERGGGDGADVAAWTSLRAVGEGSNEIA
jgi:hypothetical protein